MIGTSSGASWTSTQVDDVLPHRCGAGVKHVALGVDDFVQESRCQPSASTRTTTGGRLRTPLTSPPAPHLFSQLSPLGSAAYAGVSLRSQRARVRGAARRIRSDTSLLRGLAPGAHTVLVARPIIQELAESGEDGVTTRVSVLVAEPRDEIGLGGWTPVDQARQRDLPTGVPR